MEHKNIPNDGLHEPKNIVFASAGDVYTADGSGSGTWEPPVPRGIQSAQQGQVYVAGGGGSGQWSFMPGGWAIYDDSGLSFTANTTESALTIDGMGPLTNEDYLPRTAPSPLWDSFEFTPVSGGDVYGIEVVFEIEVVAGASSLEVRIGDEVQTYTASLGIHKMFVPMHVFDTSSLEPLGIGVKTDAGTVDIGSRRVKIVQVYGA